MQRNGILKIILGLLLSLTIVAAGLAILNTVGDDDQSLAIADVIAQKEGEVTTSGIVTAKLKNTIQIQDDTAAIAVRPASLNVEEGDAITVTGTLDHYNGLRQLQDAVVEDRAAKKEMPEPVLIDGNLLVDHQSELAIIENITVTDVDKGGDWANYTAEDDQGNTFIVRDDSDQLNLKKETHYRAIKGIVSRFKNNHQLIPRNQSDINTTDSMAEMSEDDISIHHIQGDGHESPLVGEVVEEVAGIITYTYGIGSSHYFHMQNPEDQYDGDPDTSEGIVVYTGRQENVSAGDLVEVTGEVNEYFIEGYSDKQKTDLPVTQINARDDQGGNISVKDTNVKLPPPVKITSSDIPSDIIGKEGFDDFKPESSAIDFWESIEGMRVEVAPAHAIAPQEHGDLVVATEKFKPEQSTINSGIRLTRAGPNAQTMQLKLLPNDEAENFAVKTGDKVTEPITGVVNYGYGHYKIYADLTDVQDVLQKVSLQTRTKPSKDDNKLTVAAYNVENFSANSNETSDDKAASIATTFVEDMNSPDIIGLVEVMDNNGPDEGPFDADASKSYERLISNIEKQEGPSYAYTNINPGYNQDGGAPHGNIQVGFLYNPNRVSMMDAEHGTATQTVGYRAGQLTLNPGRITPEDQAFNNTRKPLAAQFKFRGESVVVIANHLYAKLEDDPLYGQHQPPELVSESKRVKAAKQVNTFVQEINQDNPDENVVVLGDMNDDEFSETLNMLAGDELVNMIEKVPAKARYTFVYEGMSQVLDHILVSDHLADKTEIDIIHINADITDIHGRASDHDPVWSQIDLKAPKDG